MKSLDELLPLLLPHVPAVPEPLAHNAILQAANQFCERTRLWRVSDSLHTHVDTDIAVPYGAILLEIASARLDGKLLEPISLAQLEARYPDQDWRALEGEQARYITQSALDQLRVVPSVHGELTLTLVLVPGYQLDVLPDFLIDRYRQVLVDGALAKLLMMPGQPYSNPELGLLYQQRFQQSLDHHSGDVSRGQQRAPLRARGQLF